MDKWSLRRQVKQVSFLTKQFWKSSWALPNRKHFAGYFFLNLFWNLLFWTDGLCLQTFITVGFPCLNEVKQEASLSTYSSIVSTSIALCNLGFASKSRRVSSLWIRITTCSLIISSSTAPNLVACFFSCIMQSCEDYISVCLSEWNLKRSTPMLDLVW